MRTTPDRTSKSTAGRRPRTAGFDGDTRAAILAAARSVFARRGFEGASTREVAEIAHVNNAMIYYHFHGKRQLYRAVLADAFSAFDRVWEHRIFGSDAPARAKIQKYIEEFIRFQHANEELRKIMSMEFAACSDNCQWMADEYFSKGYDKLAALMQEGIRNGELKKLDISLALPSLVGMIIYSFMLRPITEHVTGRKIELTAERFGKFVTGMFFDGLNAKNAEQRAGKNK